LSTLRIRSIGGGQEPVRISSGPGCLEPLRHIYRRKCYNGNTNKEEFFMALIIASREVDGVTVLDLSGRITLGEGSVQIRDAIRDLIAKGQKSILLDMGDVNYIDSSGLG